ncbi:polysaccharide biosynthesis protein [Pseudoflavonifractor capillosus]|uniref:Polysaccharide biosynthesis protein n=1 Tax=Pseudoflavonifractor capillosus TaxID=106588 RepID=A0A921MMB3_9FIRM|nr:polysaccharide biosynthesis protein [Pseudoflavonifractor capillosus]HJG86852.1 polysaccharide biosynthesis protein [Pseudoflavonifractor capillosus]
MSNAEKKSTFFGGAAILAASAILVKVIGAIYRIPLGNILSDEVMADYNSAYNIYNFFLTISTAGLPVALSKTISEANALGRHNQVQRTFRVAFITFLILGLLSFFCMTVLAAPMAQIVISNPKAVYCVMALAPSVLCVCIMSAFRGYFQGHFNMMPTGISQVIEAFFKLVVGLALALFLVNVIQKPELGSVGAIIGVSCGSVVALLYILFLFFRDRKRRQRIHATDRPDGSMRILSNLLKLAIPITLGSAATSLVTLIDTKLVMSQLQSVYQTVDGLGKEAALDAARGLYGIYSKTMSIYNLPFSMMVPLTACIIPAVSASLARRDHLGAQKVSESALRIGLLLALPMGMGLFALGGPIMGLLFPTIDVSVAGPLLSVLGLASVFVALQLLCNSILQANGMVNLPILAVIIGGVVKVVVNFILVGNPNIRINGAPVGTLTCFIVISALEIFIIRRSIPAPPSFLRAFLKPFVPSVIMAAAAWATYGLLTNFLHMGNSLATIGGIGVGVVVYLVLVLALRVLSREDLELMPKGDKIAKILHIK